MLSQLLATLGPKVDSIVGFGMADFDVDVEARITLAASTGRLDLSDCSMHLPLPLSQSKIRV